MIRKLGDIVSERALAAFAGRERELEALLGLFDKGGPLALHVHGVAGIGKSSLLEAFAARARATGGRVVRIDCRAVEPTYRDLSLSFRRRSGSRSPRWRMSSSGCRRSTKRS